MELQSNKTSKRIKPIENNPKELISDIQQTHSIDISKIVDESKANLMNEPTKRKRRTKAELLADPNYVARNSQSQQSPTATSLIQKDRTQELKPAFELYSDLFLAKPLEIPELKLSEEEAQALAQVTNNLMNAFPEYFNSSDPKVAAIMGAVFVAAPIGYSKYKIYNREMMKREKQNEPKN